MWAVIGRYLVKGAVWCFDHPDQVIAVVNDLKAVKEAKNATS